MDNSRVIDLVTEIGTKKGGFPSWKPPFYVYRSMSISRVLSWMVIYLGCAFPRTSCGHYPEGRRATSTPPYSALLPMGFAKPPHHCGAGGLLHHRFSFAYPPHGEGEGVFFSVALSVGSLPLAVSEHPALRSPDFPLRLLRRSDHLTYSTIIIPHQRGGSRYLEPSYACHQPSDQTARHAARPISAPCDEGASCVRG